MEFDVIIVAAGRGERAGGDRPKQYQPLRGRMVVERTIGCFTALPGLRQIILVVNPADVAHYDKITGSENIKIVAGGAERAASVRAGLDLVVAEYVLIHDAARPFASVELINGVLAALEHGDAAAPALQITDAIWRGDAGNVAATVDRSGLFAAQTPQGFRTSTIRAAHDHYDELPADDVEVARADGVSVKITPGSADNIKITTAEDFIRAERILGMDIRSGSGFDVHKFGHREDGKNDHVTLCGVAVPHDVALMGHSDADVAMHALTDALYGALSLGDIGRHFPPSEAKWKNADSAIFLEHAVSCVAERNYKITQADITIICEMPKIGPHADAMRKRLAEIMNTPVERISVKATTSEGLGFTGRKEGIAAQALVTLVQA